MNPAGKLLLMTTLLCSHGLVWAGKQVLSCRDLLRLAERNSQSITEAQYNVLVAQKDIDVAKANYYPIVNAEALDSSGFPGSSGWIGLQGLVGSPYRKGLTGGLVARQLITDFGRTAASIKTSEAQVEVSRQTAKVTAYQVKVLALEVYYQCAKFKRQQDIWATLAKESSIINKEAKRFVKTGQRSIVDNYLSDSQTEEAWTAHAYYQKRVQGSINELAVITGLSPQSFECPPLADKLLNALNPASRVNASPFVKRAQAGVKVAQIQLMREKADLLPQVIAVGSTGGMQGARLVQNKNYALGIGVMMPLMDINIKSRINRAAADVLAKKQDIAAQQQFIEQMNAKLDEIIFSSLTRIKHLNLELTIAREGFDVAKKRYFKLEGDLVDLREAWRNLARAETTIEDARSDLLQARGAKSLLNGHA